MSRVFRLNNYVDNPYVGQIVYKNMGSANYSGKVVRVDGNTAEVKWPNGEITIEGRRVRDSELDLIDRKQSVARALEGIRKAKAL